MSFQTCMTLVCDTKFQTMEINGHQICLVTNILQNIYFVFHTRRKASTLFCRSLWNLDQNNRNIVLKLTQKLEDKTWICSEHECFQTVGLARFDTGGAFMVTSITCIYIYLTFAVLLLQQITVMSHIFNHLFRNVASINNNRFESFRWINWMNSPNQHSTCSHVASLLKSRFNLATRLLLLAVLRCYLQTLIHLTAVFN